jgi:hypothetical protein
MASRSRLAWVKRTCASGIGCAVEMLTRREFEADAGSARTCSST